MDPTSVASFLMKQDVGSFLPAPTIPNATQSLMGKLDVTTIPPHPKPQVIQRGGDIHVNIGYLHLDPTQIESIQSTYDKNIRFHKIFSDSPGDQSEACKVLGVQGLDVTQLKNKDMKDLGSGWSRRWSTKRGKVDKVKERVLLQCQCGSSSEARKNKDDANKTKYGFQLNTQEWNRKMPYDFTGCLAHMDIMYHATSSSIIRITGILEHNSACEKQGMQRLPPIPLHPHVWQIALKQLDNGASISSIQAHNRHLYNAQLYDGQIGLNLTKANIRYLFMPQDSCRLYRMHARLKGVDLLQSPEQNLDNWLNPGNPSYNVRLAHATFHYKARTTTSDRFKICIQTEEMRAAAWKYAHGHQLILDGTFGICDRRILLFIGMAIDEQRKGVPIVFFLFSAPTGSQATHAGYDTNILTELLHEWVVSLGKVDGMSFQPKTAITDSDTKERGALVTVWPGILLLLCKFHIRMAWANKRKMLIKMGNKPDFFKQQVVKRIQMLDTSLISSENYNSAQNLIEAECNYLVMMSTNPDTSAPAKHALAYLDYLKATWMPQSLWKSWSQFGKIEASRILGVPIEDVAPTTNHLESFNSILKNKYIRGQQRGGKRLRYDLLIFLLVTQILPAIFERRAAERSFYDWLSSRFRQYTEGDIDLVRKRETRAIPKMPTTFEFTWWTPEGQSKSEGEVAFIVNQKRIGQYNWLGPYQLAATCASSLADTRLVSHQRYSMAINCYGWGRCSCPAFEKFGFACKHLWAFRMVISQMKTPYTFIFPETFEEAQQIYCTIFIPNSSTTPLTLASVETPNGPNLVEETLRPPPLSKQLSDTTDINDILNMITTTSSVDDESASSDSGEGFDPDSSDVENVNTRSNEMANETKAAINHQHHARLSHDVEIILPKLHGIFLTLKDLGSDLSLTPHLEEFLTLTGKIATLGEGRPSNIKPLEDECNESPEVVPKNTHKRTVNPMLMAPARECSQKRKKSTHIF